jgi:hypothetical protein
VTVVAPTVNVVLPPFALVAPNPIAYVYDVEGETVKYFAAYAPAPPPDEAAFVELLPDPPPAPTI